MIVGETGVLIRGPSGAGKSDLALRLIDRGAVLVSDDYCEIETADGAIIARAPQTIAGQMEVRGVGILRTTHCSPARVGLLVDLVDGPEIERLPEKTEDEIAGVRIAWMQLDPRHASADAKVRLMVKTLTDAGGGQVR